MSEKLKIMLKLESMDSEEVIDKEFIRANLLKGDDSLNNRRVKALGVHPEELFKIFYGVEPTKCYCEKPTAFVSFTRGYLEYCSTKCSTNSPKVKEKIFNTYVGKGVWVEDENRTDWELYRKNVRSFSEANDLQSLTNFDKRGKGKGSFNLDHRVSIKYGFDNDVPPEIIGCVFNLKFISEEDNIRKGVKGSMTVESLYNLYYSTERVTIDTNRFIDEPDISKSLIKDGKTPVIPYIVLSELDNLKRNPDLKRAAQSAIKSIRYHINSLAIINVPTTGITNDELIVKAAKEVDSELTTSDIGASVVALVNGVPISDFAAESGIDEDYTGYIMITGDINYEKHIVQLKEMQLEEFNERFNCDLKNNQYAIIERIGDKNDIWVNKFNFKEETYSVSRISSSMKPFRDAGIIRSTMDDVQMCALDAVFDNDVPLTVIDGSLGTGKTLLSVMGALACTVGQKRHQHYNQILVTKSPESINKGRYTGFKPGTTIEKLGGHLGGFKSNLSFLLDTEKDKNKKLKVGEEPPLSESELVWANNFKIVEIDEMQGDSVHENILLVDEWQLLDEDGALLVMSRIAEGSKVVLIGDTRGQTYGLNRANEGFRILYQYLGEAPEFSYIKLENIYRSRLAKFVARIYES